MQVRPDVGGLGSSLTATVTRPIAVSDDGSLLSSIFYPHIAIKSHFFNKLINAEGSFLGRRDDSETDAGWQYWTCQDHLDNNDELVQGWALALYP